MKVLQYVDSEVAILKYILLLLLIACLSTNIYYENKYSQPFSSINLLDRVSRSRLNTLISIRVN